MLQRKPSMPTMSTVPFQSPSLPTISHLPVTVTGAFASLLVAAAVLEFVLAALLVLAGLLAAALELVTVTLPPQAAQATTKASTKSNNGAFIRVFPFNWC